MKLHRNSYYGKTDGLLKGYSFHSSSTDASKARTGAKEKGLKGIGDVLEIGKGKEGLIKALNDAANRFLG